MSTQVLRSFSRHIQSRRSVTAKTHIIDEQPMKRAAPHKFSCFTPLDDTLNDQTMTRQDDAERRTNDAKEMNPQLQQTTSCRNKQISDSTEPLNTRNHVALCKILFPTRQLNKNDEMFYTPSSLTQNNQ